MNSTTQKVADVAATAGVPLGWAGWFASHIAQINGFLQFILLLASIVATAVATRYHWRKTPK